MDNKNLLAEISDQVESAKVHKAHIQNYIKSKSEVIKAAAEKIATLESSASYEDFVKEMYKMDQALRSMDEELAKLKATDAVIDTLKSLEKS